MPLRDEISLRTTSRFHRPTNKSLWQTVFDFVWNPDFVVVTAFAMIGIFLSLGLPILWSSPFTDEVIVALMF
jgi:hypothetical protein